MANSIILKHRSGASGAPSAGNLDIGEIALNTLEGKAYIKKDDLTVVPLGGIDGSVIFAGNLDASAGLPASPEVGQYWNVTTAGNGYLIGDLIIWNGTAWDATQNVDSRAGTTVAPLVTGKIPSSYLPDSIVGGVKYIGTWDATSSAPASPAKGDYYIVNVAGTTDLDGITDWQISDWAVYNGSTWDKIDNTAQVTSVCGEVGAVDLGISHIDGLQTALNSKMTNPSPVGSTNQVLTWVGGEPTWAASQTGGVTEFTGLDDTPSTMTGAGGQIVIVNAGGTALEFTSVIDGGTY